MRTGKMKKQMFHFPESITAPSVSELFTNLEKYIEQIPQNERYNLHYTLCECHDGKKARVFKQQNIIAFDIDAIDLSRIQDYPSPVLSAIGDINPSDVVVVHSGRGLHIILEILSPIDQPEYFEQTRKYYKLICDRINRKLRQLGLPGEADTGIWSAGHTLRLPGTMNIKTPDTGHPKLDFRGECKLITRNLNPLSELTIESLAGGELLPADAVVNAESRYVDPKNGTLLPDSKGIVNECEFLKWCSGNQEHVKEPQWRAMISITSRLEHGRQLTHAYSDQHPDYTFDDTEEKIDNILVTTKPYRCQTIETLWDGCKDCKHYQVCTSPISIKTEGFIKTKQTGFRNIARTKTGSNPYTGEDIFVEKPGKIEFEDLRRYFEECHPYVSTEARVVYTYSDHHWSNQPDIFIKGFCQEHVNPPPRKMDCAEFLDLILTTNQKWNDWFTKTTFKKINLKNGVLDLAKPVPVLLPHSTDFGFMNILPYDFDPEAECPRFDLFMDEVTEDREDLKRVLLEFAGYAFSNDKCVYAKALILLGDGTNGKSTFLNVLMELAGEGSYSSLSAKYFGKDTYLVQLEGKLFNLAEETPTGAFVDSSDFKNIVSGGTTIVRKMYKDAYTTRLNAKLIMSANDLPRASDATKGFLRRLLIVPFDVEFSTALNNKDVDIETKLFKELPGILNRIIEGYRRLSSQKGFTDSEVIKEAVYSYRDSIDPLHSYVRDQLTIKSCNDEGRTDFNHIYHDYVKYCDEAGVRAMERNLLSRKLKSYIKDYKARIRRRGKDKATYLHGVFMQSSNYGF